MKTMLLHWHNHHQGIYFGPYNIYQLISINILESSQMIYFVEFSLNDAEVENPIFDIKKAILSFLQDAGIDNKH